MRSEEPDRLTAAGWSALAAHGVRTVVDLRGDEEHGTPSAPAGAVTVVNVVLDDPADAEFWDVWKAGGLDCTPLYFRPFLDRFPGRAADAVAAVARAAPGGVLVHCGGGRDRTGVVALLLLALAGVEPEEIAADYELSLARQVPLWAALGWPDQGPRVREIVQDRGTTIREAVLAVLDGFDAECYLLDAGLRPDDVTAVRARLLPPP